VTKEERSAYNKAYRAANLDKITAQQRQYYRAHRSQKLATDKAWAKANAEYVRHHKRRWEQNNPGKIQAIRNRYNATPQAKSSRRRYAQGEKRRLSVARYMASEKGKVTKANAQARRKSRLSAAQSPGMTLAQWQEICTAFNHACAYCLEVKPLTRDHVIPICRGGLDQYDNIVPACSTCNSSKSGSILAVWYGRRFAA